MTLYHLFWIVWLLALIVDVVAIWHCWKNTSWQRGVVPFIGRKK